MTVAGADLNPVCSQKPSADNFLLQAEPRKLNPVSLWTWARENEGLLLETFALWSSCYRSISVALLTNTKP